MVTDDLPGGDSPALCRICRKRIRVLGDLCVKCNKRTRESMPIGLEDRLEWKAPKPGKGEP